MAGSKLIKASPEERQEFASRLEEAREKAGYKSQADLAEVIGVRPQTVQVWASGGSMPKARMLEEVAQVLGVSKTWLLTGEETSNDEKGGAGSGVWSPGEFERELEVEMTRLEPDREPPTRGSLEIGGIGVEVDLASPRLVGEIKYVPTARKLDDQIPSALWQLAVVRDRDRWLDASRVYLLVLIGPGLIGGEAEGKLANLKKQANVMGMEIILNPTPRELAQMIHQIDDRVRGS